MCRLCVHNWRKRINVKKINTNTKGITQTFVGKWTNNWSGKKTEVQNQYCNCKKKIE